MTSKSIFIFWVILSISNLSAQETVPYIFSANTPANAAEVNENFDFLTTKSIGMNLVDGEIEVNVDCTNDAAALNNAYADYVNYREINFLIKGNCYGDITVKRTFDQENETWTNNYFQVMGQTIHIAPQELTAGLIPNDLSGKVTIWGGFGGGYYINDITITLGENDVGVAYSRNGHGSVNRVTINGPETPSGYGIWVQEGAQVYISEVTINNVYWGITGINNASIRLNGFNSITSQSDGFLLIASSVRQGAGLIVTSTEGRSIVVDEGSNWFVAFGNEYTTTVTGDVEITDGSNVHVGTLTTSDDVIISDSNLSATALSAGNLTLDNSDTTITGGNISGATNMIDQSFVRTTNTIFGDVNIAKNSTFNGQGLTITTLNTNNNSLLDIASSTVSTNFDINNSRGLLSEITFNGTTFNINQSTVQLTGTTKMSTSKLACTGLSQVDYQGISDLLTTEPNSNCLDQSSVTTLMSLVKMNHIP
ncbi:MAG: hypothetical protein ACI9N9_001888 [Enterobacterales bacterium]